MIRSDRHQKSSYLSRIELRSAIPECATSVSLTFHFDTSDCGAMIYSSPKDNSPAVLDEQTGQVTLNIKEPQCVFVQLLDGSSALHFSVSSYKVAR